MCWHKSKQRQVGEVSSLGLHQIDLHLCVLASSLLKNTRFESSFLFFVLLIQVRYANCWDSACSKMPQMARGKCSLVRSPLGHSRFGVCMLNPNLVIPRGVHTRTPGLPAVRVGLKQANWYQLTHLNHWQTTPNPLYLKGLCTSPHFLILCLYTVKKELCAFC